MKFISQLHRAISKTKRLLHRWSSPLLAAIILVITALTVWQTHKFLYTTDYLQQLVPAVQKTALGFWDPASTLAQTRNYTHILILGRGGAGHEAPNLTDTIILVSISHQSGQINLLSLPRDIWIPSMRAKLNTAYHYGQQSNPGGNLPAQGGLVLAKSAVSEVTDLPIHYAIIVDFSGFEKIINLLGGLDIKVGQTFDDYKYPIPGKETAEPESDRYQHLHFEAGQQHMDGKTALQFVRSRNAIGPEGTDLARSERQKKVLLTIKDKLLTTQVIFNRSKLFQLKNTLGESIITDISDDLYPAFARLALDFRTENLRSTHLPVYLETQNGNSASESALLINPPISQDHDFQWVLIPKTSNFTQIHQYINCLLENSKPSDQCL